MSGVRRHALSCALGLGLGVSLAAADGCAVNEQDEFLSEASSLMCEFNERCPGVFQDPSNNGEGDWPRGDECEDAIITHYQSQCSTCSFQASEARTCLRRMKRGLRRCSFENVVMIPCDAVFQCGDEGGACDIRDPSQCSVSDEAPGLPALLWAGLLVLGVHARRRRAGARA